MRVAGLLAVRVSSLILSSYIEGIRRGLVKPRVKVIKLAYPLAVVEEVAVSANNLCDTPNSRRSHSRSLIRIA